MAAPATGEGKRSWRGAPRGTLVRRSRNLWRWLLSGLALVLIGLAVLWAWPRPLPRTMLLVLSSDREERTLPLVPFSIGDCDALLGWARGARVPACQRQLIEVTSPRDFVRRLAPDAKADNRLPFTLEGHSGGFRLSSTDTLVIYIKGHGLAIDVSDGDRSDVRPVLVKSLSEKDLAGPWSHDESNTIDMSVLLKELAQLTELRKLVILDAVHVNYDPRLGTLVNAFPQAVRQAAEQLPASSNLWIIVGQGDGELATGLPGTGRSAFVDSLLTALERKPGDTASIEIESLVAKVQRRMNELGQEGRGSFKQTLQKIFATSSGSVAAPLMLPTGPLPAAGDKKAPSGDMKGTAAVAKVAQAVPLPSAASSAVSTARQVQTAAGQSTKPAAATPPSGQTSSSTAADAAAAPAGGQAPSAAPQTAAGSAPGAPQVAAAAPAGASEPPKTNLDLAWEARDRLRARFREGWSPVHVAPDQWRRVEELLSGFDEEELCRDRPPRDQATLQLLRSDLELLEAIFRGERAEPSTDECQSIAEAYRRFTNGPTYRSFQAPQASGFDGANEALKVFAEGVYRAFDYVRLHGQTATILDGGPLLNDGPLEALLDNLRNLRRLLNTGGLADGRLTEGRLRELSRVARDVESLRSRIDDDIAAYARSTAAAPQSPGRFLRARLLLHSPLLSADARRALRRPVEAKTEASSEAAPASSPSISKQLAANLGLERKRLSLAAPAASSSRGGSTERQSAASLNRLMTAIDAANTKAELLGWAPLGRRFREFAEELPNSMKSEQTARAGGQQDLPAPDMLDLYLATLLIDGRDAQRWRDRSTPLIALAQPLKPELMADRVQLTASTQRLQLESPGAEGRQLSLTIEVQSERPPPYSVALDLNWNSRDLNVVRQEGGPAIRNGKNELPLDGKKYELTLRLVSLRESTDSAASVFRAQAKFANAPPAAADIACQLPRPDQVELTIAADDNLEAAKRRIWFQHGQQGGRLNFFANREKSFNLYLTNLSSEEKRLHARLYRVPPWAAGPAGRLFDPRAVNQLLKEPAELDRRMSDPGADLSQILRGCLIAQTNDKEPVPLSPSQRPVKVLLAAVAATVPPPAGAAARPNEKGEDITSGLLLVLTSADGKGKPHVKWIELQMLPPDDLLEIKEPAYRDGKLTFRVGLKDPALVEEMGLAKQPLMITWESQALPPEVREATKEAQITASDVQGAAFSALVPASVTWPLYIQLHVDRNPRGLVASLDRRGNGLTPSNLKENQPPVVHILRLATSAARSAGPPQKDQILLRPRHPSLPFPSSAAIAEGITIVEAGQPVIVKVDEKTEKTPVVRLEADFGADVRQRFFAEAARVRLAVERQSKEFASDRQVAVRLTAIDAGGLQIASEVSDFLRIEFDPIEVKQDKRIELVADVVGENVGRSTGAGTGPDVVPIILDRTPPKISQLSVERTPPRTTTAGAPPQSWLILQCRADDGEGSGVASVSFIVGFDVINNGRLDESERRPPIAATRAADGVYRAEYPLPVELPSEQLLVEATATDYVQFVSSPVLRSLSIPRPVEGGERTTFGGKKLEPEPPTGKKKK